MTAPRAWVSWSCGKDGALALHVARARGDVHVAGLLTTLDAATDEVTMSRVPGALLRRQAAALGVTLHTVELPSPCPNEVYERCTTAAVDALRRRGCAQLVFGDVFLSDVRAYREQSLAETGVTAWFPLWDQPTGQLAAQMLGLGMRAVVVCVDPTLAPPTIAGRWWDEELLRDLPDGVDPCGENGEFHTFVTDGPGFGAGLDVVVGDVVERDGFVYAPVHPPGEPSRCPGRA